jgi:hypothetical protein
VCEIADVCRQQLEEVVMSIVSLLVVLVVVLVAVPSDGKTVVFAGTEDSSKIMTSQT